MKLYEKIILGLFVVFIFIQLFDFTGATFLLVVSNLLLSLSYLIGGYWLLNDSEKENNTVSIVAGVVFGLALFFFWKKIMPDTNNYTLYFPVPNIIFCLLIAILLFIKRKEKVFVNKNKLILIRSFVITLFTAFFFYIPTDFIPYTSVIYYLNAPRKHLQHNLKVVEYNKKTETALKNEEYEKAIDYATKAEQNGRLWLDIPSNKILSDNGIVDTLFLQKYDLQKMNLIYDRLYRSYYNHAMNNSRTKEEELKNFKIAHQFLTIYNFQGGNWKEEEITSLTLIARTLSKLDRNEEALYTFKNAFSIAQSLGEKANQKVLYTYEAGGDYLSKIENYELSNQYYKPVIDGLLKDSLNNENRIELANLYKKTAINHQKSFNYQEALNNLNQSFFYLNDENNDIYWSALYHYGLVKGHFYKYKEADSILSKSLSLYGQDEKVYNGNIALCNYALHLVNIELSNYEKSENYIKKSLEIVEKETGKINAFYKSYLASYANLNVIKGNYQEAKNQYKECLVIHKKTKKNESIRANLLIELALIEIKLYNFDIAQEYIKQIESILEENENIDIYNFINNWAYLNYSINKLKKSEKLYNEVIEIDKKMNASNDMSTATASNGLALIHLEKKNYKLADTLFNDALKIHKDAFKDASHYSSATLYLNMARLYILQKNPIKADRHLKISLKMNEDLFDKNHLNFAEIYLVKADLALLNKDKKLQKDFLEKALSIFSKELEEDNIQIRSLKAKINSIVL
ncbi:tetratricopeptide repeat protein [Bernardetia sp. ABR2-2B]|uniref:tetratricopeptide repeat protein n=1 Tax=Bernardetia sp. ABR2-2B TaxID=3127472 RepID=UPI0030CCB047